MRPDHHGGSSLTTTQITMRCEIPVESNFSGFRKLPDVGVGTVTGKYRRLLAPRQPGPVIRHRAEHTPSPPELYVHSKIGYDTGEDGEIPEEKMAIDCPYILRQRLIHPAIP